MKTYAIVIYGDSYYKNRIKQLCQWPLLATDMHHYAGLAGCYENQFTGSIKEVKKHLKNMAIDSDCELITDKFFEDNLIYFEILSRSEIKNKYGIDILNM